jgi:hypothetical protein
VVVELVCGLDNQLFHQLIIILVARKIPAVAVLLDLMRLAGLVDLALL